MTYIRWVPSPKAEQEPKELTLGQQLHIAETAISIGRKSIRELVSQEPVDEVAVAAVHEQMAEVRTVRNELRARMAEVNRDATVLPSGMWWPR